MKWVFLSAPIQYMYIHICRKLCMKILSCNTVKRYIAKGTTNFFLETKYYKYSIWLPGLQHTKECTLHKGQKIVSKCLTVFFLSFCLRIYEYAFLSIIIFSFLKIIVFPKCYFKSLSLIKLLSSNNFFVSGFCKFGFGNVPDLVLLCTFLLLWHCRPELKRKICG